MKCPKCQFENRDEAKFCGECGHKFIISCPECGTDNRVGNKFCDECGSYLKPAKEVPDQIIETKRQSVSPPKKIIGADTSSIIGERKYVTVLFSDLTGYTAMSEKLDPEEVKEITSRIFGEVSKIIKKYDGFIEKFVGDSVMALFGVPKAHEDDPVRAIKAAREIHRIVESLSPEIEKKIERSIAMHTGINTGLVVTGEVNIEKGTHGISGDTINLASRLQRLAKKDEILVGQHTFRQAEGYYNFEELEPHRVKGKKEPIQLYKLLTPRGRPIKIHRPFGLRANLIGRKGELNQLEEAIQSLFKGKGQIFSIFGDAGTGKSRLIEEFKATIDLKETQWIEGHSYAYAQKIPYFPLIDILNHSFHIEEGDHSEIIRGKIESTIEALIGNKDDIIPYVGSLFSLDYPDVADIDPEFWKSRLHEAILIILSSLAKRAPTVFLLEDLHWADPSSIELLRRMCLEIRQPAIVLCVYRPPFRPFTKNQLTGVSKFYKEILLQDLSPHETQDMLMSLLKTEDIPSDLMNFVQKKAEGNPFYLEELINSLIESDTLIFSNGRWNLDRKISEFDLSTTVHGLISARLDLLEKDAKRILQKASVVGRVFHYEILKRITDFDRNIDQSLKGLEKLDLIRTRSTLPDLEYIFKHALTQEVVYNGLLRKERKDIHERIGLVMEQLFHDRLIEYYEALSFHFQNGHSLDKAVKYLIMSGEKNVKRYALEESHQYYMDAFELLSGKDNKSKNDDSLLVDLLIKWALVFYYQGYFKNLTDMLSAHEDLVKSLDDKGRVGLFYAWLGFSVFWQGERMEDSYQYLRKALELGEQVEDPIVIGYSCAFLSKTCAELGLLEEGITYQKRAQKIVNLFPDDAVLYMNYNSGKGYLGWFTGNKATVYESGKDLLDVGKNRSNIRLQAVGYLIIGMYHYLNDDIQSAIECTKEVHRVSEDPYHTQYANVLLGMYYLYDRKFEASEDALRKVVKFSEELSFEYLKTFADLFLGVVAITKGDIAIGMKKIREARDTFLASHRTIFIALSEYLLGSVYWRIVQGSNSKSLSLITKNFGFLIKEVPFAGRKAKSHFSKAIKIAESIGAKGFLGQPYLDLGLLHKLKGRNDHAQICFANAIEVFKQCKYEMYLKHAKEAMLSLEQKKT